MANEAQVTAGLRVLVRDPTTSLSTIDYQSRPTTFNANVAGTSGPFVGTLQVTTTAQQISTLSSGVGGLCRVMNQSPTYTVMLGMLDTLGGFFPMLDLLPGETYVYRLSQFLGQDEHLTGTGGPINSGAKLALKTIGGSAKVLVEVFPA